MMKGLLNSFFFLCALSTFGQEDTSKVLILDEVNINDHRFVKRLGLYDEYELDQRPNIRGFDQLSLYADVMSDEVWSSKNQDCIILSQVEDEADTYLKIHWNKDHPDCDWVGFGFGWDFWSGKDMSYILDTAAVQLHVRSTGKKMGNLPWAMGFEDYANGQSWIGFSSQFIEGGVITNEWTTVTIPLGLFPFEEMDCDASNIKQMLFQVFAEDDLEINDIQLVPFAGKLRKEIVSNNVNSQSPIVDGKSDDWKNAKFEAFGDGNSFSIAHDKEVMYVAVKINDKTPRQNSQTGTNLWKGDAIEFAFSTNPTANPKRKSFLLSDYHFGLSLGAKPYTWNWSEDKFASNIDFSISEDGSFVEMAIPMATYTRSELINLKPLSFEIAIDQSDSGDGRIRQERWNSAGTEGFHNNPSLWGTLVFK